MSRGRLAVRSASNNCVLLLVLVGGVTTVATAQHSIGDKTGVVSCLVVAPSTKGLVAGNDRVAIDVRAHRASGATAWQVAGGEA